MQCGRDLAFTGDGVAYIFSEGWECTLMYTLFDLDGSVNIPPLASYTLGGDPMLDGIRAASSGDTVLAVADGWNPHLYLFDTTGLPLDAHILLSSSTPHPRPSWEPFWEGDAYAVVWMQGGKIAYRRFRVE